MHTLLLTALFMASVLAPAAVRAQSDIPAPFPTLEAPLDWTLELSDEVTVVLTHEATGSRLVVAQLEHIEAVQGDVLEVTANEFAQGISHYLGVDAPAVQAVTFQNQPGFEFRTDDGARTRLQRLFERQGKAFSITVEVPTEAFGSLLPVVEKILNTLRLYGN